MWIFFFFLIGPSSRASELILVWFGPETAATLSPQCVLPKSTHPSPSDYFFCLCGVECGTTQCGQWSFPACHPSQEEGEKWLSENIFLRKGNKWKWKVPTLFICHSARHVRSRTHEMLGIFLNKCLKRPSCSRLGHLVYYFILFVYDHAFPLIVPHLK